MGSLTGITGTLTDRCACITVRNRALKITGKVELNFLSSQTVVCYSQEAKYNKLNS